MIDETLREGFHKETQATAVEEGSQAEGAQAASRATNMATDQSKYPTKENESPEQELNSQPFQLRMKRPRESEPNPSPYIQSLALPHTLAANALPHSVNHAMEPIEDTSNVHNEGPSDRIFHTNKLRHVAKQEKLRV
jgi:hypothetical protein